MNTEWSFGVFGTVKKGCHCSETRRFVVCFICLFMKANKKYWHVLFFVLRVLFAFSPPTVLLMLQHPVDLLA